MAAFQTPTQTNIKDIVEKTMKMSVSSVKRFPTGLCHYVYDVKTNKQNLVVRVAHPDNSKYLEGALFWYEKLKPKGVPLPEIYYRDIKAQHSPYHFYIMDRLDGTDLGNIYSRLSTVDKNKLTDEIVSIQNKVAELPRGKGFGEVYTDKDKFEYQNWSDFFYKGEESKKTLKRLGIFNPKYADILQNEIEKHTSYFNQVKSIPFLDDITTKNIIINENNDLSGIVDVDFMTYGDKIFNIALTRMSLLASQDKTDYIDIWCQKEGLNDEQYEALRLYTLSHCVGFMCEVGQSFNKDDVKVDMKKVEHLKRVFDFLANSKG